MCIQWVLVNAAFIQPLSIAFQAGNTHTGVTAWLGSHTAGLGVGHIWHLPRVWHAQGQQSLGVSRVWQCSGMGNARTPQPTVWKLACCMRCTPAAAGVGVALLQHRPSVNRACPHLLMQRCFRNGKTELWLPSLVELVTKPKRFIKNFS